ncbi:hypothetical protein Pst134EA_028813 [Puccinia striiformis f. sp. tritici]|uniref:hypothetical protein n=1 Tax=Puccinia striiformis f. sp. tritici TaxID=168172 RepID=UPI0020084921|nr:hypothetical protein Pst134EA_028813 [Puccinia striiformis f. sp. tritici]KAH9446824.1 hypothetical protein Pst134EA_028813 [Puccinia striiformis f. sp. tritici]
MPPSKPSISRPPDASCEPSGRGVKHQEDDTDAVDSPVDSNEERGEPAAKRPKPAVANKRAKRPHKNQRHVMTSPRRKLWSPREARMMMSRDS